MIKNIVLTLFALLLAGCVASTTIRSVEPDVKLSINDKPAVALDRPFENSYATTTFGNYRFAAVAEGFEPFYGILPLQFKGANLALDILFFAPATFFNLRGVYPYYEFDVKEGVVRYRRNTEEGWTTYKPSPAEAQNAIDYFNQR